MVFQGYYCFLFFLFLYGCCDVFLLKIIEMIFEDYICYFEFILINFMFLVFYDNLLYFYYMELNKFCMYCWLKIGQMLLDMLVMVEGIGVKQYWIVIIEFWCGDVFYILFFIYKMVELNLFIQVDYQLCDIELMFIN